MAAYKEIDEAISGRVYDNRRGWAFWAIVGFAVAVFVGTMVSAALANNNCDHRPKIVGSLTKKYFETPKAIGTIGDSLIMEVFVAKSGSWTIFTTDKNGCTKVIAAGQDWDDVQSDPLIPGKNS